MRNSWYSFRNQEPYVKEFFFPKLLAFTFFIILHSFLENEKILTKFSKKTSREGRRNNNFIARGICNKVGRKLFKETFSKILSTRFDRINKFLEELRRNFFELLKG